MSTTLIEAPVHKIIDTIPDAMPYPTGTMLGRQYAELEQRFAGSALRVEPYTPHPTATYHSYPDHLARPYQACRIGLPDAPKDGATLVLMAGMHLNELAGNSTVSHIANLATAAPELLTDSGIAAMHLIDASPTSVDQQGSWIEGKDMPPLADYLLTLNRFDLTNTGLYAGGDWSHAFSFGQVTNPCSVASALACKGVIDRSILESDRVVVASLHNALVGGYGGNVTGFSPDSIRLLNELTAHINPELGPAPQDECTKMGIQPITEGWYPVITGNDLLAYEQSLQPDTPAETIVRSKPIRDTGIGYALASAERVGQRIGRAIRIAGVLTEPPTHATNAFSDLTTPSSMTLRGSVLEGAEKVRQTLNMAQSYATRAERTCQADDVLISHIKRLCGLWIGDDGKGGSITKSLQKASGAEGDEQLSEGEASYRTFMYTIFPLYASGMAFRLAQQIKDTHAAECFRTYVHDTVRQFESRTPIASVQKQELVRHQFAGVLAAALAIHSA